MSGDIFSGLALLADPWVAVVGVVGMFIGVIIGAIPGLGPTMAIALLIPFTFSMEPVPSIILLLGVYQGGVYGGSISAILLNIPGTAAAAATAIEGYMMRKAGKTDVAMKAALYASVIGNVVSCVALLLIAAPLASVALHFGPPETAMVMLLAFTVVSAVTAGVAGVAYDYLTAISLLQFPARRSEAISDLGHYVTLQPPRWRYVSLNLATHVMGALLMFGSFALLAPLILEGVRRSGSDRGRAKLRHERQVLALFRGFSWMLVWAPTTAAQAVLHRTLTGLDDRRMHLFGLGLAVVVSLIGWADDMLRFRGISRRMPELRVPASSSPPAPRFPTDAAIRLGLVFALLVGGIFALGFVIEDGLTLRLMIACPVTTVIWIAVQVLRKPLPAEEAAKTRGRALAERFATVTFQDFPNSVPQSFLFGAVGIFGTYIGALLSPMLAARADLIADIPPFPFLLVLALSIVAVSLVAISPMIFIVIVGSILATLPVLPADPTEIALAMLIAWALSGTASPNSFISIVLARYTESARYVIWRRNVWFNVIIFVVSLGVLFWLAQA